MRKRADIVLVERGFFASRARAQAAIAAGLVRVGGVALTKPSEAIADGAAIEAEAPHPYVSRGGVKLAAALDAFALDPAGLACLDVGASTGGFTDVLLKRGARTVVAVDVGHGQLDPRLAARSARPFPRRARRARPDGGGDRRSAGRDRLRRQLHLAAARAAACACAGGAAGLARQPRQAAVRGRPGRDRQGARQERGGARARMRRRARLRSRRRAGASSASSPRRCSAAPAPGNS